MRVYLAGKMGGRLGAEVLNERRRAVELCKENEIEAVDPARGENIEPHKTVDLKMDYVTMKSFVAKDEYAISTCEILLILTGDTPSEGTLLEFGYAKGAFGSGLNLPVVVVAPRRCTGDLMGFVNIKADALFQSIEDAIEFIAEHYKGV